MNEDDVVEQTESMKSNEDVEKEAREYSQEYITELISAAKEYLPKTVWDHIHRRAVPKAGGKASGKSKRNARDTAAQEASSAASSTATVVPEVEAQLAQAQAQQTQKADDPCEVAKQKCESMKAKAAKSSESVVKADVEPFVGSRSKLTFVAASPGIIESVRKAALVGPTGRLFNEQYLEPLGLTRDDVAILYLVPNVLKSEDGKVREPTLEEIDKWAPWFSDQWNSVIERRERSDAPSVALGHTVKKSLSKLIDVTLPHPNSLGTKRTNQELVRKMEQLKRMLTARETGQL